MVSLRAGWRRGLAAQTVTITVTYTVNVPNVGPVTTTVQRTLTVKPQWIGQGTAVNQELARTASLWAGRLVSDWSSTTAGFQFRS